jgi:hypothetical protein
MDESTEVKETPKVNPTEPKEGWWDKLRKAKQRQAVAARKRRIKRDALRHQGKEYRY